MLQPSIVIKFQPQSQGAIAGSNVVFKVLASGVTPLTYLWSFNGLNISVSTNNILLLSHVQTNQAGTYSVMVTNVFGKVTGSNAVLSVYGAASAVLNVLPSGGSNQFQFAINGVAGFDYALQGSTDLINWINLLTNTSPFVFADTNAAGFSRRFYRAVYLP